VSKAALANIAELRKRLSRAYSFDLIDFFGI
jgi:hypothetical protein